MTDIRYFDVKNEESTLATILEAERSRNPPGFRSLKSKIMELSYSLFGFEDRRTLLSSFFEPEDRIFDC